MNEEQTYTFSLELQGFGTSREEAWAAAVEAFTLDPGIPPDEEESS